MEKIDLILTSAITASDGSIIASGATMKFDAEFKAGSTDVRIFPKIYRNRELFESGFTNVLLSEKILPFEFDIHLGEEVYYSLTIYNLYERVKTFVNLLIGGEYFELRTFDG